MSLLRSATVLAASLMLALAAHATPKVVKKVPPDFPREAAQKGISTGVVKAKLTIEADGKVSDVEIVEAEPKRVFDRAVKSALMEWKFEPGEKATHEVKLVFKNED
ncbi:MULTISPECIES: energy transducer TonB [Roseateles]|uniref:Protein TonB n=1 Tax=Pelomonas caseinilytica TaxID=2906763 RepID=A0ABS8XFQ2_9BURK|nr:MULTISPECIES: energy transducer TonB [unclassified Roseateles]MCE4537822.1 energy transducer TonB [Pelomonas sp. P7]HEV6964037.1 energy transducer TonB [Roseateles sp.]